MHEFYVLFFCSPIRWNSLANSFCLELQVPGAVAANASRKIHAPVNEQALDALNTELARVALCSGACRDTVTSTVRNKNIL